MQLSESIRTSVHSYNKAYDLFSEIREIWNNLEGASDYQYMEALDKVEDLTKQIYKVDLKDMKDYLKQEGKPEELDDVKHNLDLFKEGAYRIGREILGWSYYEDLMDASPRFITALKKKYSLKYPGEKEDLVKQFVSLITKPDNVERYKSNIESIIRGNMTLPYFSRIFDALVNDTELGKPAKPSSRKVSPTYPNPPEMFVGKHKEEWEESQRQQEAEWEENREEKEEIADLSREKPEEISKKGKNFIKTPDGEELEYDFVTKTADAVITYYMGKDEVYSYLGEAFISLSQYKKLFLI
jgi:hypothetical protein